MKKLAILAIVVFLAACSTSVIDRATDAAAAKADAETARCILNPEVCQ